MSSLMSWITALGDTVVAAGMGKLLQAKRFCLAFYAWIRRNTGIAQNAFLNRIAREFVTLNIEDTDIRYTVAKRDRVLRWGSAPLGTGAVKDGLIVDPDAVAASLKDLMASSKIKKGKVIAALCGYQSVHRIVEMPRMSGKLQTEAVLSEAKRSMPVSLDQLYLSWQVLSEARDVQKLLLMGTPRNMVDSLYKCLRKAGLRPHGVNMKPLALAKLVDRGDALIVDMEPEGAEIIVMSAGIPVIMRSVRLHPDSGTMDWTQHVLEEFERTLRFYESNFPGATLSQETPLFLTGKLADEKDLAQAIAAGAGFSVQKLTAGLRLAPDMPAAIFAANIGLATPAPASARPNRLDRFVMPDLEVLPPPYRIRKLSARQGLLASGVVMGVMVAVPFYQVADTATVQADRLNVEYKVLQQSSSIRLARLKEARALELEIAKAEARNAALLSVLQDYQGISEGRIRAYNSLLVATTAQPGGARPDGVVLTAISEVTGGLKLRGVAPSYEIALGYADALRRIPGFSEVQVHSMEDSNDGTGSANFDISLDWE